MGFQRVSKTGSTRISKRDYALATLLSFLGLVTAQPAFSYTAKPFVCGEEPNVQVVTRTDTGDRGIGGQFGGDRYIQVTKRSAQTGGYIVTDFPDDGGGKFLLDTSTTPVFGLLGFTGSQAEAKKIIFRFTFQPDSTKHDYIEREVKASDLEFGSGSSVNFILLSSNSISSVPGEKNLKRVVVYASQPTPNSVFIGSLSLRSVGHPQAITDAIDLNFGNCSVFNPYHPQRIRAENLKTRLRLRANERKATARSNFGRGD